jgi:uncharacterized lipoprotein YajG
MKKNFITGLLLMVAVLVIAGCQAPPENERGLSDQPWGSGHQGNSIPVPLLEGR